MEKVDFLGGEVRSMRAEIEDVLLPPGEQSGQEGTTQFPSSLGIL
jgi:hypothetical protein